MMRLILVTTMIWLAAASVSLCAQAAVPSYDVVSVKPNKSIGMGMRIQSEDDSFSAQNVTLLSLIANAYAVKPNLISGAPAWMETSHYDFEAKVAEADLAAVKKLGDDQQGVMLQRALEDRFQLKTHRETKILPVYELVVAKGGAKMKQATPGDPYANGLKGFGGDGNTGLWRVGRGELTGQAVDMAALAVRLYNPLKRKVVDKTGLTGLFDITLKWTPEAPVMASDADSETTPGIFTAIQEQLGLRLQPSKGPVETLVIDKVEKPVEN